MIIISCLIYRTNILIVQVLFSVANRNSSPTYHWVTPYECLKRETSFGDLLKTNETRYFFPWYRVLLLILLVILPNVPSLSHVSLNSPAPFVFPHQQQLEEPS